MVFQKISTGFHFKGVSRGFPKVSSTFQRISGASIETFQGFQGRFQMPKDLMALQGVSGGSRDVQRVSTGILRGISGGIESRMSIGVTEDSRRISRDVSGSFRK